MQNKIWLLLLAFVSCTNTFSRTLIVGKDQPISSVSESIVSADVGDTILIKEGIYYEHSLVISKPLTLLGEGMVVLDAGGQPQNILFVDSDSVGIFSISFRNVGVSYLKEIAAIKVSHASDVILAKNQITNCFFGIYLEYARNTTITNHIITGSFSDEASAGNAIHAWKGNHLTISNNVLTGHRDGIYFEFIDSSLIKNNRSEKNLRYGLHFMFSNNDEYRNNRFINNGAGVAVMFSKNITMFSNQFANNWGAASYGLLLKEISDGQISDNFFTKNTIGILAEGANRLEISRNQFINNGTAIDMKGNCLDNKVVKNNFLINTFDVVTNSKQNNNNYNQNYWSPYIGYDLDRDGYGDVSYRPVNLFAKITNEIPSAAIMLHSLVVNMIEAGEKIFPQLIPKELQDKQPKMKPYEYD